MADESTEQEWTYDQIFGEDAPEADAAAAEAQESDLEARLAKIEERDRKLGDKLKADESAQRVESMVKGFYANASDTEKELAAIFLEGSETPTQVERAIKLIKTKAGVAQEESEEQAEKAFAPPVEGTPPRQKSKFELTKERALQGDRKAQFETFMATEVTQGTPDEDKEIADMLKGF